jgi:transposase-like protein
MRKTANSVGRTMHTAFENFVDSYGLNLLTVKVQCPNCNHIWGIKIDDYDDTEDIPERKFKCSECGYYKE